MGTGTWKRVWPRSVPVHDPVTREGGGGPGVHENPMLNSKIPCSLPKIPRTPRNSLIGRGRHDKKTESRQDDDTDDDDDVALRHSLPIFSGRLGVLHLSLSRDSSSLLLSSICCDPTHVFFPFHSWPVSPIARRNNKVKQSVRQRQVPSINTHRCPRGPLHSVCPSVEHRECASRNRKPRRLCCPRSIVLSAQSPNSRESVSVAAETAAAAAACSPRGDRGKDVSVSAGWKLPGTLLGSPLCSGPCPPLSPPESRPRPPGHSTMSHGQVPPPLSSANMFYGGGLGVGPDMSMQQVGTPLPLPNPQQFRGGPSFASLFFVPPPRGVFLFSSLSCRIAPVATPASRLNEA